MAGCRTFSGLMFIDEYRQPRRHQHLFGFPHVIVHHTDYASEVNISAMRWMRVLNTGSADDERH